MVDTEGGRRVIDVTLSLFLAAPNLEKCTALHSERYDVLGEGKHICVQWIKTQAVMKEHLRAKQSVFSPTNQLHFKLMCTLAKSSALFSILKEGTRT